MTGILTITLNPAVDDAASVDKVEAGPKLYCSAPRIDPGGGGVNVARVVGRLGGQAAALVTEGGAMGQRLVELMAAEGVNTLACHISGETRYSLAVTDAQTRQQYRFSLPGEPVSPAEADALLLKISEAAPRQGYVVLSGGVAPGMGDDFPQRVQATLEEQTDRLVVDTSKAPLMHLISSPVRPVHVLRLDRSEVEKAAERSIATIEDNLDFAQALVDRDVARLVVTGHGAQGSLLVSATARFFCPAPKVEEHSKIGAGDALVGAFTLSLSRGEPPEQALQWGVAAAAATVGTEGTALCDRATTEALLPECKLEKV